MKKILINIILFILTLFLLFQGIKKGNLSHNKAYASVVCLNCIGFVQKLEQ